MAGSVAWAVAIYALSVTNVHAVVGGQATMVSITGLGKTPEDYHISCGCLIVVCAESSFTHKSKVCEHE